MSSVYRVFFDYSCPYCYLGKAFLQHVQKVDGFALEFVTLEIHPDAPAQGMTIFELFPDVNMPERENKLNSLGAPLGIAIGNHQLIPNTRLALQATEYAKEQGKQTELVNALFDANFLEKRNISTLETVLAIAKEVGLDSNELAAKLQANIYLAELQAHFAEGLKTQVDVVPTVFKNGEKFLEGVLTLEQVQTAFAR